MPMYNCTVRDVLGNMKTDLVEATNEQVLIDKLQGQGFFIIKFSEALEMAQSVKVKNKLSEKFHHKNVKLEDLLVFSRQLSTMLEAGVALMRSLEVTLSQIQSKDLYEIVKQTRADVEAGKSFSQAISKYPKVFGQFWVSLIEVGEASGTLSNVLTKLAEHVEEQAAFKAIIISAVIYPIILCVAAVGAVIFFAFGVAPKFEEVFTSMHAELPMMTKGLLATFKFIKNYFVFLGGGLAATIFMVTKYINTPVGRLQWEQLLFRLPIIGDVLILIIIERFTSQMAILIGSGVPILLSLDIVSRLVENDSFCLLINRVREDVREGKGLAETMSKEDFFPAMAVQMIKVGEETGELAKMLNHVAIYYKKNVESFMKRFGTIFEPFMLLFMALMIGVIVVAIFLPLFKLGQGGHYK